MGGGFRGTRSGQGAGTPGSVPTSSSRRRGWSSAVISLGQAVSPRFPAAHRPRKVPRLRHPSGPWKVSVTARPRLPGARRLAGRTGCGIGPRLRCGARRGAPWPDPAGPEAGYKGSRPRWSMSYAPQRGRGAGGEPLDADPRPKHGSDLDSPHRSPPRSRLPGRVPVAAPAPCHLPGPRPRARAYLARGVGGPAAWPPPPGGRPPVPWRAGRGADGGPRKFNLGRCGGGPLPGPARSPRVNPSHPSRGPCAKRARPATRLSAPPHPTANFPIGRETRRSPATVVDWTKAGKRQLPLGLRDVRPSWPAPSRSG